MVYGEEETKNYADSCHQKLQFLVTNLSFQMEV